MSNELLEKVIVTGADGVPPDAAGVLSTAAGGLLKPDQADRFIDYMFDQTVLASQVRQVRMRGNEIELERMGVGERILRVATEAVDDGVNVGVAFAKVSVTSRKFRLDWELSSESLEDNIEGEQLEDHIARLMTSQAANDLEDLAINGDTTSNDPLLKGLDGWGRRLEAGANVVDAAGANIGPGLFNRALRTMPRQYMQNRRNLKWFVPAGLIQDYMFSLVELGANDGGAQLAQAYGQQVVPNGGLGVQTPAIFGVPMQEVPLMAEYEITAAVADDPGTTGVDESAPAVDGSDMWLTDANNLIWAIKREIEVYREFKPKKDTIEYTVYTRVGTAVENPGAAVVVKNVAFNAV